MYYDKWYNHFLGSALHTYQKKKRQALLLMLTAALVFTQISSAAAQGPFDPISNCLSPGFGNSGFKVGQGELKNITSNSALYTLKGTYSLWPAGKKHPPGWIDIGSGGSIWECIERIEEIWDLRPLSRRKAVENTRDPQNIDAEKVADLDLDDMEHLVLYLEWMVLISEIYLKEYPETAKLLLNQAGRDAGGILQGQNWQISRGHEDKESEEMMKHRIALREHMKRMIVLINEYGRETKNTH